VSPARRRREARSEAELVQVVARYLSARGYTTYANPDGADYFDLVARRGDEVGLVEAKVSDARTVIRQALRRRVWGDWTAVAMPGRLAARRLLERTRDGHAAAVGIWIVGATTVDELRPARPWVADSDEDPYRDLRVRFRGVLDAIDRGEIPAGASWDGVLLEIGRASGGRGFREWRLDEPDPPPD
jgi:hypothetical protein